MSEAIMIEAADFENLVLKVIEWDEPQSMVMIGSVILLWILGCAGRISHIWYMQTFTPRYWPMRILL